MVENKGAHVKPFCPMIQRMCSGPGKIPFYTVFSLTHIHKTLKTRNVLTTDLSMITAHERKLQITENIEKEYCFMGFR